MRALHLALCLGCLGAIAKERDRKLASYSNQLTLYRIEKLVEAILQYRRDVEGSKQNLQAVELLRRIVATAQRIARFDLVQQSTDFAHAMVNRAWKRCV